MVIYGAALKEFHRRVCVDYTHLAAPGSEKMICRLLCSRQQHYTTTGLAAGSVIRRNLHVSLSLGYHRLLLLLHGLEALKRDEGGGDGRSRSSSSNDNNASSGLSTSHTLLRDVYLGCLHCERAASLSSPPPSLPLFAFAVTELWWRRTLTPPPQRRRRRHKI